MRPEGSQLIAPASRCSLRRSLPAALAGRRICSEFWNDTSPLDYAIRLLPFGNGLRGEVEV
jgi:hypothetical protein